MDRVMADLSPEALTQAIIGNLYECLTDFGTTLPGMERFAVGKVVGYFWDFPFPVFNGVVRPRFSADMAESGIDAFLAQAKTRSVPMLWWLTPGSEPTNLGTLLEARGFQITDTVVGMAVDLATLCPEAPPTGVEVRRVSNADMLETWIATLAEGYSFPAWLPEPLKRLMTHAGLTDESPCSLYLAWRNGRPVATAMGMYAGGVAGIYNVVTLPAARGMGIGRAGTLAPLIEAWGRGYRVAVLNATEMGLPVYQRLGFTRYCDIFQYLWPGEPSEHGRGSSG